MKKLSILAAIWITVISAPSSFAAPALNKSSDESPNGGATADDQSDMGSDDSSNSNSDNSGSSVELLNKAHSLLVKFSSLGTDPTRKKLLVRARTLIWDVPPDETLYHGMRKEASLDILAAIKEMKQDSPDERLIADHIRRADNELRSAISLGAKAASSS
jgi:hypothetical protein